MKTTALTALLVALLSVATPLVADDKPQMHEMPAPAKEHAWLQQFAGEWETEFEVNMEPGKPPTKGKGTETTRMLGGFWIVADGTGTMEGMPEPMKSVLVLGYSPEKKKYIGTWIDSMTSTLWTYEGTVDATGKILTLESEGPCPMEGGKIRKFREVTEIKSKDHRVFTSSMQGDDGKWNKIVTVNYRRKA